MLLLYVLYACVFWHGEADSLETDFSREELPTRRQRAWPVGF
jgi:hypothetical protein